MKFSDFLFRGSSSFITSQVVSALVLYLSEVALEPREASTQQALSRCRYSNTARPLVTSVLIDR
jgi:hypothetical protein